MCAQDMRKASKGENEKAPKPISMSNENLLRTHLFRHLLKALCVCRLLVVVSARMSHEDGFSQCHPVSSLVRGFTWTYFSLTFSDELILLVVSEWACLTGQ